MRPNYSDINRIKAQSSRKRPGASEATRSDSNEIVLLFEGGISLHCPAVGQSTLSSVRLDDCGRSAHRTSLAFRISLALCLALMLLRKLFSYSLLREGTSFLFFSALALLFRRSDLCPFYYNLGRTESSVLVRDLGWVCRMSRSTTTADFRSRNRDNIETDR